MDSHAPGFRASALGRAVDVCGVVFTAAFAAELLLKVLASGLVAAPGTYLRDPWNWLDGAVVVLGLVDLGVDGSAYAFLRTVRVLRPLRAISHVRWLKVRARGNTQQPARAVSCCSALPPPKQGSRCTPQHAAHAAIAPPPACRLRACRCPSPHF